MTIVFVRFEHINILNSHSAIGCTWKFPHRFIFLRLLRHEKLNNAIPNPNFDLNSDPKLDIVKVVVARETSRVNVDEEMPGFSIFRSGVRDIHIYQFVCVVYRWQWWLYFNSQYVRLLTGLTSHDKLKWTSTPHASAARVHLVLLWPWPLTSDRVNSVSNSRSYDDCL